MATPRKRSRSLEHQEAAEHEAWDAGFDAGYTAGREEMAFELGHKSGYAQGMAQGMCEGYNQGWRDHVNGNPRAHHPHEMIDHVSDLLDPDAH